eukprot:tig00000331_g24154.t1
MRPKDAPSDHFATEQVLEYLETRCPTHKKGAEAAGTPGRPRSPWRAPGPEWSVAHIVEETGAMTRPDGGTRTVTV